VNEHATLRESLIRVQLVGTRSMRAAERAATAKISHIFRSTCTLGVVMTVFTIKELCRRSQPSHPIKSWPALASNCDSNIDLGH
jgi:hypothetical protein